MITRVNQLKKGHTFKTVSMDPAVKDIIWTYIGPAGEANVHWATDPEGFMDRWDSRARVHRLVEPMVQEPMFSETDYASE